MTAKAFSALLAYTVLGIYVYLIWTASKVAGCDPQPQCLSDFTGSMATALSIIGGLISALVVAELAITPPGETPIGRAFGVTATGEPLRKTKFLVSLYLIIWLVTGVYAFMIGLRETGIQALSDLGQTWFGLAIAALYAYFGLKPQGRDSQPLARKRAAQGQPVRGTV
jgi:predicted metal-binding membrane protein